ncbi:MAG TPA: DMT family transporter [Alphaproteobacteria bacterium]
MMSGATLALVSAALFGASTPFAKLLLGAVDPWVLAGLLYLGSGLGLVAALAGRAALGLPKTEAPLRKTDLAWLGLIILFGGILGPVLLMLGLRSTPASSASLLLNLEGLATMAIAWIAFRENVDRRILFGAFAILAGAASLSWQQTTIEIGWGSLAIAGACLCWGIDNNLTRKLSAADPVQIAATKGVVAGAVNLSLGLLQGALLPPAGAVAAAAIVGFLGYGVSLVLFVLALRQLGTARTGAYFSTSPFIGAVLSIALLGDPVTPQLMLAAVLMGLGTWLHLTENHAHDHVHDAMSHDHRHVHDEHHRHDHSHGEAQGGPHAHAHRHDRLVHRHAHYPDLHHRHEH